MARVKNLNGTSNNTPPNRYSSWRNWWEVKTGRRFGKCSHSTCHHDAEHGAHVQKVLGGNKWYIVPLCARCNTSLKNQEFVVLDSDLVPINP